MAAAPFSTAMATSSPTPSTSIDDERVFRQDAFLDIGGQELAGIVAAESPNTVWVRSLVPKLKNSACSAMLVGGERSARQLDHGADAVVDRASRLLEHRFATRVDLRARDLELPLHADQRDHDFGDRRVAGLLGDRERGLEDRAGLHLVNLRIGDAEPAAAMAEHRVRLGQLGERGGASPRHPMPSASATSANSSSACGRNSCSGGSSRRMVTGSPAMIAEQLDEIVALGRQQLVERAAAARLVLGQDHLAHSADPLGVEEHMLGAAEADALGAELARGFGVERRLGIGAHASRRLWSAQSISVREIAGQLRLDRRHRAEQDLAGRAVERDRCRPRARRARRADIVCAS